MDLNLPLFFEVSPGGANEPPPEFFLFIKKEGQKKRPGGNYKGGGTDPTQTGASSKGTTKP
jgi:hypothetical protein